MGPLTVATVAFVCTFGGALLGMRLRDRLPAAHLSPESKDLVKMGTGLIASLSAMVLGLLVASAKGTYDAQGTGFRQFSADLILLDRSLQQYGSEAAPLRQTLKRTVTLLLSQRWPADGAAPSGLSAKDVTASATALYSGILFLPASSNAQKAIQAEALRIGADLGRMRWLLSEEEEGSIPPVFLGVLVFWFSVLFVTFGLFAPSNGTVLAILLTCAVSLGGALFLIEELDQPFSGVIKVSSQPLRLALEQLEQPG